jgi:undecaprenyl-diphosphatase
LDLLQAFILGVVQGLTEFFPVSSSAHLKFCRYLMGIPGDHLYFDLACHAGTWLALVWFLRKDVLDVLTDWRKMLLYSIALVPLVPAYFLIKPLLSGNVTGYCLILTSLLLFFAARLEISRPQKTWNVLCIGMMQALALLPGLSRSGSTIATARVCGWSWCEGAKFSFLLAVPTILGGEVLESFQLTDQVPIGPCFIGFVSSLVLGLWAVQFVFRIYERGKVEPFAWYCLGFGLLWLGIFGA